MSYEKLYEKKSQFRGLYRRIYLYYFIVIYKIFLQHLENCRCREKYGLFQIFFIVETICYENNSFLGIYYNVSLN